MPESTLSGNGVYQSYLVDLISMLKTNWNAALTKLDADATVNGTNYNSLWAVSIPEGIQTDGMKAIRDEGLVHDFLQSLRDSINGVNAKLDLDSGVADTNYAALWDVADYIGERGDDGIQRIGEQQGSVVFFLNLLITNINGILAKLDADGTVTDTNYAALWAVTDSVDETACKPRPGNPL